MASLVLSSLAGAAGGPLGAAVGALLGAVADRHIAAALSPGRTEPSRLADLQVQTSTEGAGVPVVYGAMRIAGQVIWASRFKESTSTRRVGGKTGQKVTERRYAISFAVGLCEGVIDGVGRVWANGEPFDLALVAHRIHRGAPDQDPDPLIEALEGAGAAPAYRGLAYIVFEDLDLDRFGDRIPQLSFEVMRPPPEEGGLRQLATGVCLIPGSGEFALATTPVRRALGPGRAGWENVHASAARADIEIALDQLAAALPNVTSVLLVVSWFGADLRAGLCEIRPCAENRTKDTAPLVWRVSGQTRAEARLVSQIAGAPAYGGTPGDDSVLEAIAALKARGYKVGLYPFVMMDIPAGSTLPDPWGGASQPAYPWRGRITCDPAPGRPATADRTAAAAAQIDAFFGAAQASDFAVADGAVSYAGPADWGFRRHILHYARLAQAAGGVDSFVIGSELVGLTRVRDAAGGFPAVQKLRALAADVRAVLGPDSHITYAADWTEYGGYAPPDAPGDLRFPLDDLWADPAISGVGLDWYAPLGDWRAGDGGLDASQAPGPHDRTYLDAQVEGGEGFDWVYASPADRESQTRTPVTDSLGKPWVWRVKDLAAWWANPHVERIAGVERSSPTAWIPRSKPIWFTECGVPAVDRGANQPNVFFDPKSVESALPHHSSGARDDLIQRRALEALLGHWQPAAGANPASDLYAGRMIDPDRLHLWCWDGRPYPQFPALSAVWSDGANWARGHWLNGRIASSSLAAVVADLCRRAGLQAVDAAGLDGVVAGLVIDGPQSARAVLEPLMAAYGFDARERDGVLSFFHLDREAPLALAADRLALTRDGRLTRERADGLETPRDVRVRALDPGRDYRLLTASARRLDAEHVHAVALDLPLALGPEAAEAVARARLATLEAGRDAASAGMAPSLLALEPGDLLQFPDHPGPVYRIVRASTGLELSGAAGVVSAPPPSPPQVAPQAAPAAPPLAVLIDPPAFDGSDDARPLFAASADPWPGGVGLWLAGDPAGAPARAQADRAAVLGMLVAPLPPGPAGRWDEAATVEIELAHGGLASASRAEVLGGANLMAVTGAGGAVEYLQFRTATLLATRRYRLSGLLRGQFGSDAAAEAGAPQGGLGVLIDDRLVRVALSDWERGTPLDWRAAPAGTAPDGPAATALSFAATGRALAPWRPCRLRARRTTQGVALSWIRRARRGGDGWAAGDIALIDAPEAYRVRIFDGATLRREVQVAEPAWLYAAADEIADFGAAQGLLTLEVAQVSAAHGDGDRLTQVVQILL